MFLVTYFAASLLPLLAVGVRRLHDSGFPGWFMLLAFLGIGVIVLLVFWAQGGKPGANKYGPNPEVEGAKFSRGRP